MAGNIITAIIISNLIDAAFGLDLNINLSNGLSPLGQSNPHRMFTSNGRCVNNSDQT